jgi:hypothetical protein
MASANDIIVFSNAWTISSCDFVIAMLNAGRRSRGKCRSRKPVPFTAGPRVGRRNSAMVMSVFRRHQPSIVAAINSFSSA